MSMWGPDEYRDAARSATSAETRRALYDEADRIEQRELDVGLEADGYFDRNTVAFIRTHPHCRYRLISEYGETEDLPHSGAVRPIGERKTLPGTSGHGEDKKTSQAGKIGDSRTGEQ